HPPPVPLPEIERASWNANFDGGPRRDGMAEAFVRTIKRDYVHVSPCPNAQTVMHHYQLGLITTTRFTPTRHSDIVHPVSSSQLSEARDRVRSFGGYNSTTQ